MELTNEFTVALPVDQAWAVLTDVERIAPCMPGAQLQEIEGDEYRGVVKVKVGPITAQYKGKAQFVEQDQAGHRAVLRAEGRETRGQGNASATITATLTEETGGTRVQVVTDLTITGRVAQFGRGVLADVSSKLLGQFVDCLESTVLAGDLGAAPATVDDTAEDPTGGAMPTTEPGAAAGDALPPPPPPPPPGTSPEPVEPVVTTTAATPPTSAAPDPATFGTKPYVPSGNGVRKIDSPAAQPVDLLDAAGAPVAKRVAPLAILFVLFLLLRGRRRRRRR